MIFLPNAVIVQNRNKIVNEEESAESVLIAIATCEVPFSMADQPPSANNENILPNN